jgi:nucleotide-binding universal stress UspA family protein
MSKIEVELKRILLPLDVSRDSLTALDVAFDLAAALGGEVSGLFIEDAELLAAGNLPFLREVGSLSGSKCRITTSDIEHRLHAVARKAHEALNAAAEKMHVPSSFRITRGDVPEQILTATEQADIVVLGKAGWSVGQIRKPGRTCLKILSCSHVPVLIVEKGVRLSPLILAVHDDTEAGARALDFARELSRRLEWGIAVFSARGFATGDAIVQNVAQDTPRLIVLPASLSLTQCAFQLKCPVLFVP